VVIDGIGDGSTIDDVGGWIVRSQIDPVSNHSTATAHPGQVGIDGHVDAIVGGVGGLGWIGRSTLLGRSEGEGKPAGRENGIGNPAVGIVGGSGHCGRPIGLGGAVVEVGVAITPQAHLNGAGCGDVYDSKGAINELDLVAAFQQLNLEIKDIVSCRGGNTFIVFPLDREDAIGGGAAKQV